jgi:hypothetical protein
MKVYLHYKTIYGQRKKTTNNLTMKKAIEYYEKSLKNNDKIVEVFLTKLTDWGFKRIKTLKG